MHFIDINKMNFLAGVETSLRDVCFTNFIDEDPIETEGEQYTLPFDSHELDMERQTAAQFFDALPQYLPEVFDCFMSANQFEICQEMAWQYVACRFGLDTLGFDEKLVELVCRKFNGSTRSVFVGTGLDGNAYIFIE